MFTNSSSNSKPACLILTHQILFTGRFLNWSCVGSGMVTIYEKSIQDPLAQMQSQRVLFNESLYWSVATHNFHDDYHLWHHLHGSDNLVEKIFHNRTWLIRLGCIYVSTNQVKAPVQ